MGDEGYAGNKVVYETKTYVKSLADGGLTFERVERVRRVHRPLLKDKDLGESLFDI